MKIIIYGGAFNPVHNEHINIVRAARAALSPDKIIIVPTFISPHKRGCITARAGARLKMCRLAFSDIAEAEVSDIELRRGGVSYSYVTCRAIKKQYPKAQIFFLMGADMLETFHLWKLPEEILKCATPAVCARVDRVGLDRVIKEFNGRFGAEVVKVDYVGGNVSSTSIRARAALGADISSLVPLPVRKYIESNGVYARPELCKAERLVSAERWAHTVRVAEFACEYSRAFGLDENDALCAAALHDCAKNLPADSPLLDGFCPPADVPEPVMHQYSGAFVAEHIFGVKDENILNAIRFHTSARPRMCKLEKLIYLSDLLERGRDFVGADFLRAEFKKGLNRGMLAALEHQIAYLSGTGKKIYPLTEKAYSSIKEEINDES